MNEQFLVQAADMATNLFVSNCHLSEGKATTGGAIAIMNMMNATVHNTSLHNNTAEVRT